MNDITAAQAQLRLGLGARTTFWREIWRGVDAGVVVAVKWGKTYRFDAASIEAWRTAHLVTSRADLRQMVDGRRKIAMGRAQ